MQPLTSYHTISTNAQADFKEKGSKFIGYAFPVSSVKDCNANIALIRKEHPKATHHCFAYRLGIDGNRFRANDDGEPSGTAGKPILGQIDSKELTDVLVVVVRYFGGKQLGIPGLIAAYKTTAALVLQMTPVCRKPVLSFMQLNFDYTQTNDVLTLVKKFDCVVDSQSIDLFCTMKIGIPKIWLNEFKNKINDLPKVNTKVI